MQNNLDEQRTITLESDDGRSYTCQVLGTFEFDDKEYALLLNLSNEDPEEQSTVIMGLYTKRCEGCPSCETDQCINDQAIFRTIETDEEFERVVQHVKELAEGFATEVEVEE